MGHTLGRIVTPVNFDFGRLHECTHWQIASSISAGGTKLHFNDCTECENVMINRQGLPVDPPAVTSVDSSTQSAFHAERLLERCLGDRGFCAVLVGKFVARAGELSAALEQAARTGDTTELARQAHAIKGMAANLSADSLQTWAAALERALRVGNTANVRPLVSRVRTEIQRCLDAVPEMLEQLAS
jgi:HPt (histidine-containing phosphotransfer) domain-containing protein